MWHKPCRTFHPWCLCIKTRCLSAKRWPFCRGLNELCSSALFRQRTSGPYSPYKPCNHNLSGVKPRLFQLIATDALGPCAIRSAAIVYIIQDKQVFDFQEEGFQATAPSQCHEMIENAKKICLYPHKLLQNSIQTFMWVLVCSDFTIKEWWTRSWGPSQYKDVVLPV